MNETKLEISYGCWLEESWGDVSLCYVERATDHWTTDSETTIDLDKEKARKIINWLQKKFNLETEGE